MEIVLILLALWTFGDPEWLGEHMARAEVWKEKYAPLVRAEETRKIAKARLKRIRKKHYNAFRAAADRRHY